MFIIYLLAVFLIVFCAIILFHIRVLLITAGLIFLILPLLSLVKKKKIKDFQLYLVLVVLSEFLLFFLLRSMRHIFPGSGINIEKAIGYSQFYGYPAVFDYIFFIAMVSLPVIIAIAIGKLNKK